ncbi:hypothetical protein NCC78_23610 [Micromonospora phytophila]|uniref:hypothetical protein n=1 Tax=Micromonospora phytophila TaxID=709888 RepID=UPI00202FCEC2|nr:hypothetical protein [Micromonospora phytophila]MCM0677651.1 hypothetical protein [Micromonospora phytophila]
MLGSGIFMASAVLFFTRFVGLPLAQVALGMGIAALVGLLAGIPIGHLAAWASIRYVAQRSPRLIWPKPMPAKMAKWISAGLCAR